MRPFLDSRTMYAFRDTVAAGSCSVLLVQEFLQRTVVFREQLDIERRDMPVSHPVGWAYWDGIAPAEWRKVTDLPGV